MAGDLDGRVCVITGAAGGIGQAMLRRFVEAGARLYALDRFAPPEMASVTSIVLDLGDAAQIEAAFARIAAEAGVVHVLVNNAAANTRRAPVTNLAPAEWDEAIAINLTAAYHTCRFAIPLMPSGGSIINMASQLGSVSAAGRTVYSATKGALIAYSKALAIDHAAQGIRVNSLSPGAVGTARVAGTFGSVAAAEAALAPLHLLNRLGRVEEIAEAALFLASDRASFMTGSDMLVDGGYCAR
ncbi:MAG: SDR family oxidoreductase [Rhodospirillales bacterium]|nr:SDR family oxidoreductase [Rhodospirillales bacterium]